MQQEVGETLASGEVAGTRIAHLRQILLWPVNLLPLPNGSTLESYWAELARACSENPWHEVDDEFSDPAEFQQRHYNEFVTFLPPVQRFLYGQGLGRSVKRIYGESPIKVMRRSDVAQARVTLSEGGTPVILRVVHADLMFFFDIDICILALEVAADDIELSIAQDALFRFGRAYPAYWEEGGRGGHCPWLVEWLSATGEVLAASDYGKREKYLAFVCKHRAPAVASHWEFLLFPLVLDHSDKAGALRYRQLEYYRMPYMAFFSVNDTRALSRPDLIRMALGNPPGASSDLPHSESYLARFEERFVYDRHCDARLGSPSRGPRIMSTGETLVVVGDVHDRFFCDSDGGFLGRFRHQHFMLFMIAHFQKAALHLFSDRLVAAVSKLDISDADANRTFRREIRAALENFLRFAHRYWFLEIANQAETRALYDMTRKHLNLDAIYRETREELHDMGNFLEVEAFRRQSDTVVRLTVVTIFSLIGTVTTGFLGMNILAWADQPTDWRIMSFIIVLAGTTALTLYTLMKSTRLAELLETFSDEKAGWRKRLWAFKNVWWRNKN